MGEQKYQGCDEHTQVLRWSTKCKQRGLGMYTQAALLTRPAGRSV